MGFTFPGGTSPRGTGSSYSSRDRFPTTSHEAQDIAARRWVCPPKPSKGRAKDPPLLSLPVIILISLGSRQDETFTRLGRTGGIQWLSVDAAETALPRASHSSAVLLRDI